MITSRSRQCREGWLGRRRTYKCRQCGAKIHVDTLHPLPVKERICNSCKYEHPYIFVDKNTGEEQVVRAYDVELAALRAWEINPNLTFKVVTK